MLSNGDSQQICGDSQQICGESSKMDPVSSTATQVQVNPSHLEPRRSFLGNRDSLMKKIEMPVFEKVNTFGWIVKVERFFSDGAYTDEEQLELVSVSLEGEALSWYHAEIMWFQFDNWKHLKSKLMRKFGSVHNRGPSQSLFCLKQTGPVKDYVHEFEMMSAQVEGLDEAKLEGIFLNGFTPEMRSVVHLMKPSDLPELIVVALSMEFDVITQCE